MYKTIEEAIKDLICMMAYERGHAAGQEEVDSLEKSLLWDFKDIITRVQVLEDTMHRNVKDVMEADLCKP